MSYTVLSRKWRPQIFEEIIGQSHITKTLINAIHRPGYYQITLTSEDLHSGIYLVKIVSENETRIRKIALVK